MTLDNNQVTSVCPKQSDNPTLSVIIPVHNSEKSIIKCLDSVINQTYRDIEIICIDDGSTDSSYKILKQYTINDSRIKLYKKNNGGAASARNVGIDAARGEFISFLDSDDWILPDTYEKCLCKIGENDMLIFGSQMVGNWTNEEKRKQQSLFPKYQGQIELSEKEIGNIDGCVWDKIFRREIIEKNNIKFPEGKIFEDLFFYWTYVAYCKTVYCDCNCYHRYVKQIDSVMDSFKKLGKLKDRLAIAELVLSGYEKNNMGYNITLNTYILVNCYSYTCNNSGIWGKIWATFKATDISKRYVVEDNIIMKVAINGQISRLKRILGLLFQTDYNDMSL